ncbi:MAG TPA: OmpA family protein [Terriglobales bacterium]|nr:OmpA family protein [Terriglobales bacterium]
MKRSIVLLMLAMAIAATAQQGQAPQASAPEVKLTNIVARQEAPTYSDVYCSGFISKQPLQRAGYVAGGWDTPHQTHFVDRGYVYLQGSRFAVGTQYWLVRQVRDLNRYEVFRGQDGLLRQLGRPYADVGRVRVMGVHNNIAITQVEFNCTDIMPGDAAIPFAEREIPALHGKINFDRFAPPNGKLTGKIVMAKDFDTMAGMGRKVYLNLGANQGVKVGDYFRAVRTYNSYRNDAVENLSFKASYYDDNQVPAGTFPYTRLGELPRVSLGEMVVLNVTPTSSTAMVTLSLQDVHLGDGVELEEAPPEAAAAEPSASPLPQTGEAEPVTSPLPQEAAQTPAASPQAPVIACTAEPAAVRAGETSTIACEASSADHRPLSFSFSAANARLVQRDNTAVLDTRDLAAGPVQVLATVTDDRDLTATARTTVNVDPPRAALVPTKLNFVSFTRNSAHVDNSGKAVLDGVALRLERDTDSSLVVLGLVEEGENKDLAQRRAASAAQYLAKEKGIDEKRLHLQDGGEYGGKAELWMVPPGTKLQEADLKH